MWALQFDHVTKRYRGRGYRSLRGELARSRIARPAAGPSRAGMPTALDDVSFEIAPGESVGVIGPNGAGKSTALRLAARISRPSDGVVRVRGRVGALIEVGAGIHPELTGRENIWLYGAILGLRRHELAARFDDIVAFAELEDHLDVPVKRYSSGMQLRLGFSVAAAIAPDVLVVDEALAVGDARFQVRCLERMAQLVREGAAVVYVSHDLASVQATCRRAMLLVDGTVRNDGPVDETIGAYLRWIANADDARGAGALFGENGEARTVFAPGEPMTVRWTLPPTTDGRSASAMTIALGIRDGNPWNILGATTSVHVSSRPRDLCCHISSLPLQAGVYEVWTSADGDSTTDGGWHKIAAFRVVGDEGSGLRPAWLPPITMATTWGVSDEA